MPDFPTDYPDMVEPAYILFERNGGSEFAFGCCTGHIWEASTTEATSIDFSWDGNDEMDDVSGDGSAELQPDGSLGLSGFPCAGGRLNITPPWP
jgi:hypothetical protein